MGKVVELGRIVNRPGPRHGFLVAHVHDVPVDKLPSQAIRCDTI
jgi:hypothetical protein